MNEEILIQKEHEAGFHTTAPSGKRYSAWKFSKICPECYKLHIQRKGRGLSTTLSPKMEAKLEKIERVRSIDRELHNFR